MGITIPASRVNDGLCEVDCCDGSDERPGVCPNTCKEVGEAYRKKRDAERKLRKTGSKIRSTYIAFAHKEQKRLEALVESNKHEIVVREKEVAHIAELTESVSAAALAHRQESPLYKSLIGHHNALKSLQREHQRLKERERTLGDILAALRTGYNPNYQDMAVLEAVRGYEQYAKLPHINDAAKDDATKDEADSDEPTDAAAELEEGAWTAEQLENDLGALLSTDHVSLLLEHDEHVQTPSSAESIFNLASYIPDSFLPQYEDAKETLVNWLRALGIVRGGNDAAADSSRARQALTDAENKLNQIKTEQEHAQEDLKDIFDVEGFGIEGEWKKLDGTCLEKDTGEYTYEVCLFNEAKQKPNKGGSNFSLGKFQSWNPDPEVKPGTPEFYSKQIYKHGTRCWNGPERSVIVRKSPPFACRSIGIGALILLAVLIACAVVRNGECYSDGGRAREMRVPVYGNDTSAVSSPRGGRENWSRAGAPGTVIQMLFSWALSVIVVARPISTVDRLIRVSQSGLWCR
ncbi:hypothetical protein HGRIS_009272 [Hohenbuehelia grisea]|uniref:Glucosidase 2 subunit beta n=1 Tax=Hohenbuehelia grisea TaxID=104357 RepID=A0ABR3J0S8_9AGAR